MINEKDQYPKNNVTIEKITEESEDKKEVITVVNNEYEEKAVKVAIAYMDSFNSCNGSGCDELLNFPHIRLAFQGLGIYNKPPMHTPKLFDSFVKTAEWNHTCWDYRHVIQSCDSKVHLAIKFSRYRANGTKIGSYSSLWVITNQKGHWGIKLRSSFAQ
ncbi:MAG: hypothetical protein ACFFDK_01705 [Promethearchaeota archaeon]